MMETVSPDVAHEMKYGKVKLLIVDDDPMTCRLLALQLDMEGYECTTLSDPERVLEIITVESPDLILIDYHLGRHAGLDLLRSIREHEEYQYLPVIVMSGIDRRQESVLAGANAFALKPFNLSELVTIIQAVMERQEA